DGRARLAADLLGYSHVTKNLHVAPPFLTSRGATWRYKRYGLMPAIFRGEIGFGDDLFMPPSVAHAQRAGCSCRPPALERHIAQAPARRRYALPRLSIPTRAARRARHATVDRAPCSVACLRAAARHRGSLIAPARRAPEGDADRAKRAPRSRAAALREPGTRYRSSRPQRLAAGYRSRAGRTPCGCFSRARPARRARPCVSSLARVSAR